MDVLCIGGNKFNFPELDIQYFINLIIETMDGMDVII